MKQVAKHSFGVAGLLAALLVLTGTAWGAIAINSPDATVTVKQGESYKFSPEVSGAQGSETFSITSKPTSDNFKFDEKTGQLSVTPDNDDVGTHTGIIIKVTEGEESASTNPFTIEVTNVNDPPKITTLVADIPGTIQQGVAYNFQVAATDPDEGDTYSFSLMNAPSWLSITPEGKLTGTPGNDDVVKREGIMVFATDAAGANDYLEFNLEVTNKNDAPVISGTPVTEVLQDASYAGFTPTAEDIDKNDTLTFSIMPETLPAWLTFDPKTGALTAGAEKPTNNDVKKPVENIVITVTDSGEGNLQASLSPFTITVVDVNDHPEFTGDEPANEVEQDATYTFTPQVTDIDGDTDFEYFIANQPEWATFNASGKGVLTGTPGNKDVGEYKDISISVSDKKGGIASKKFTITVTNKNDLPKFKEGQTPPKEAAQGQKYSFTPSVSDPDINLENTTEKLTFEFTINPDPSWIEAKNSETGEISGTPKQKDVGTSTEITIRVKDKEGLYAPNPIMFTVTVKNTNDPPKISFGGGPKTGVKQGEPYDQGVTINDPDGDTPDVTVSINGTPLDEDFWLQYDAENKKLTGTPSNDDVGTIYNIVLTAKDASLEDSTAPFNLTVENVNDPPVFEKKPPKVVIVYENKPFPTEINKIEASDIDEGDVPTLSIKGNSAWLKFNPLTGILSGTPDTIEEKKVTVTADDGSGTATYEFNVKVLDTPEPPSFTTFPRNPTTVPQDTSSATLLTKVTAEDPDDGDTVIYNITGNPDWLMLHPTSGELKTTRELTQDDVKTYNVEIFASDKMGLKSDMYAFKIVVTDVNDPPVIDASKLYDRVIDEGTSVTIPGDYWSDVDNSASEMTFSLKNAPSWLSISQTGAISGTPPKNAPGVDVAKNENIEVTVTDKDGESATGAFSISVNNRNDAPTLSGTPPGAFVGKNFSFEPAANDPDGDGLTGRFTIENEPDWATFDTGSGKLSGTPTEAKKYSGVKIMVSDGELSAELVFDIVVKNNSAVAPGDINGDGFVDLKDAILALKIVTGISAGESVYTEADVNGDDPPVIGIEEAIYILQKLGGGTDI